MATDGGQWINEFTRCDGVKIEMNPMDCDTWVVIADGTNSISTCPCCDKPLATLRAARMVADVVYPVRRPAA